ncbi:TetR/AcrR family transcriptional regulator [Nocardioides sp. WS12]|uniref:TetR/AcrR family transcriptional regulator n=1 Tax=Nocardioides sp. WS12 TaxID=2486272 RepID=UPI0015F8FD4A|nr:TetR/AcrR family transcriptional regulator [Nocardioides sp. WS12]
MPARQRSEGPGPRRRLAPEARRAQLLAVAEDVFARLGFQGTAVDDIAAEAGVTRTLIYKYFADKDEIYLECVRVAREALDGAMVSAAAQHDAPEQQLRAGFHAYFGFVRDGGSKWDVLFGGGAAATGSVADAAAAFRYQTVEVITALLRAGAPKLAEDAAMTYAHAISGAAEQAAKWWRRNPDTSIDTLVERMMDVLWAGLEKIAAQHA